MVTQQWLKTTPIPMLIIQLTTTCCGTVVKQTFIGTQLPGVVLNGPWWGGGWVPINCQNIATVMGVMTRLRQCQEMGLRSRTVPILTNWSVGESLVLQTQRGWYMQHL